MSTTYALTYEVSDELLKRAMTAWIPQRQGRWGIWKFFGICAVVGVSLGVFLNVTGAFDLVSGDFLLGSLIGFYAGLLLWLILHKRDVRRIAGFATAQLKRHGPIDATYSAEGVTTRTGLATASIGWGGYDQVIALSDATALRAGAVIYAIPNAALPEGVTPAQFQADLTAWQAAAADAHAS